MIWLGTRYCYKTTLNNPAKYYLRCSFIIFSSKRLKQWMPHDIDITLSERSPSLNLNTQFLVICNVFFLCHEWMNLYLIYHRTNFRIRKQLLKMMTVEIADTNWTNLPLTHEIFHYLPRILYTVLYRPMYK